MTSEELEILAIFTNQDITTWQRIASNESLKGTMTREECRKWDQLLNLANKLSHLLEQHEELFFEERPFLVDQQTRQARLAAGITTIPKIHDLSPKRTALETEIQAVAQELTYLATWYEAEKSFRAY